MKRHYTITTIIITVILVLTAIFAYKNYLEPMYRNSRTSEVKVNLAMDSLLVIRKNPDQGSVFGIELEIEGSATENFEVKIKENQQALHSALIKRGEVSFFYKNDWYSDSVTLLFIRNKKNSGDLVVSTRFLSTN